MQLQRSLPFSISNSKPAASAICENNAGPLCNITARGFLSGENNHSEMVSG